MRMYHNHLRFNTSQTAFFVLTQTSFSHLHCLKGAILHLVAYVRLILDFAPYPHPLVAHQQVLSFLPSPYVSQSHP